jgi:DNA invertase Pin-like site-specific DNA recombinase
MANNNFPFTQDDIFRIISEESGNNRVSNVWAIYARKSRFDPRNPGYSMDIQPEIAEEYARAHGAKEIKLFEDAGRSGKNSQRPGFQRMLYEIKAGRVDVVVFHRLDRVFRNLKSLLSFIDLLKKYNVRVISVTENLDTDTWWGRLVVVVLGSLAEAYVWQASDRTREGLGKRRSNGLHLGRLPFGYCNGLCSTCNDENGKEYCPLQGGPDRPESKRGALAVPHPVDRHAVVLIYKLYQGGMSFREIAVFLNNSLVTLPNGTEVKFHPRGKRVSRD